MPIISFGYPQALFLLLLLPLVYLIARPSKKKLSARPLLRWRNRRLSIGLRLLIITLLVLSIADIQLITQSDKLAVVFLLDGSDSVGAGGKQQGANFIRQASEKIKDNQEYGVAIFGQDVCIEKVVDKQQHFDNPTCAPGTNYTNLAEAVRLGTSMLPNDSQHHLVLISDGNQNLDEVRSAAKLAASTGIQIDVVPLEQANSPEVSVGNISVPSNLREGEQFSLTVNIDSNYDGTAKLYILQQNQEVSQSQVSLKKGSNTFSQALTATSKGFVNYTVRIIPENDTLDQNNEANAYSVVKGKPRVLLVDGHPEQQEAANLQKALTAGEIQPNIIPPERLPNLTDLTQYDALVLVDVPASSLTANNLNIIQAYVKNLGKGMIVIGGEESYGLGGYFRTPLEEMLPVELQLPNKLQAPSVAMALVIDRSGSMAEAYNGAGAGVSGVPKIEIAKDAAYLAANQLNNSDQVGLVTFDTTAQWVVNLAPMGNPSNLVSAIGRIAPGGGTQISTGLSAAVDELKKVTAQNKHIILLTDGQDSDNTNYDALIAEANKANITISTVGLGKEVDERRLKGLADQGGGRYYFVTDPSNLPKIFTKETHLAYRSYIVEEPFVPTVNAPSPILKGITATPQLLGYVGAKIRPLATTALVTGRGDPLLAHWQVGLGRVVAWTSDAKARWATDWLKWNDFPRFWAQTVRWTIAESETGGMQVSAKTVGNKVQISADAINNYSQYLNGLEINANVVNSNLSGSSEEVTLSQTAPGHYEGSFVPKNTGSYIINVQGGANNNTVTVDNGQVSEVGNLSQTVGAVADYSPEYKQLGTNKLLLDEIASLTGGHTLTNPEEAFNDNLQRTNRIQSLWQFLVALLLLLYPLDIGIRRGNLSPRALLKGFRKRNQAESTSQIESARISPEVNRLFMEKERAYAHSRARSETHRPGGVLSNNGELDATSGIALETPPLVSSNSSTDTTAIAPINPKVVGEPSPEADNEKTTEQKEN
ncbi:VWA domain-containing protein [Candidatus Chlorohelix sp.]|uniref:VWA domain-containing protein n=1 Tax=Candidatus Chlorohelix sp. TaxID=3139201 RepID=UPI00304A9494